MNLSTRLDENIQYLRQALPLERSFDLITRNLLLGSTTGFAGQSCCSGSSPTCRIPCT